MIHSILGFIELHVKIAILLSICLESFFYYYSEIGIEEMLGSSIFWRKYLEIAKVFPSVNKTWEFGRYDIF